MRYCANIFVLAFLSLSSFEGVFAQNVSLQSYLQVIQDVFQTELVYPQEKGEFQFSFNPAYRQSSDAIDSSFPIVVEYGLSEKWQVSFNWNTLQNNFSDSESAVSGVGDLELGTQYSFMNIYDTGFHVAFGFEFVMLLSNKEKGLGEKRWEYEPYVLGAIDFPSLNNSQLFMQAGIDFVQNEFGENELEGNELNLSGGIFIPFNKIVFTSELSWCTGWIDSEDGNELYLTPGIIFDLPGNWETGFGIPVGLNKQSDKFMILALLTFEFNVHKES